MEISLKKWNFFITLKFILTKIKLLSNFLGFDHFHNKIANINNSVPKKGKFFSKNKNPFLNEKKFLNLFKVEKIFTILPKWKTFCQKLHNFWRIWHFFKKFVSHYMEKKNFFLYNFPRGSSFGFEIQIWHPFLFVICFSFKVNINKDT